VKVCFLVNDLQLSGGIGVVVEHARQLQQHHDFDVTLVLVREQDMPNWRYEQLTGLHVAPLSQAARERYDIAVATWWETVFSLFKVPAERHAIFVQSLEDRFYHPIEAERLGARLVLDVPVAFITEARWIKQMLGQLRPDAKCHLVRNGIDKTTFVSPEAPEIRLREPLRVLVEGNPGVWFKHVGAAIEATALMSAPREVTVVSGERGELAGAPVDRVVGPLTHAEMAALYRQTDVLLKLSSVEGMSGPPLEAFHMGATCVVTPVTGHDEYVVHDFNGLVVDWDDTRGTARALDLLARDRRYLHFLQSNALETARGWPSWEQAGQFMAMTLERIRREPPPDGAAASARMLADLREGLEAYRVHLLERRGFEAQAKRLERIMRLPPVRQARRVRSSPRLRRWLAPFARLLRRARR
jgi:glycosyltransferase involved in cell wall biosynthesis